MNKKRRGTDDTRSVGELLREAAAQSRGISDFFDYPDKPTKELSIVATALAGAGIVSSEIRSREENDPPDCEALVDGHLIGVEVTELIRQDVVERFKRDKVDASWKAWTQSEFLNLLQQRVTAKDTPGSVKGGPYSRYLLVVHTDEMALSVEAIDRFLDGYRPSTILIDQILLLISYDPSVGSYPVFSVMTSKIA